MLVCASCQEETVKSSSFKRAYDNEDPKQLCFVVRVNWIQALYQSVREAETIFMTAIKIDICETLWSSVSPEGAFNLRQG